MKRLAVAFAVIVVSSISCGSQQRAGIADPGLFAIEDSNGATISYLLGSLHVAPYSALPHEYAERIEGSRTLIREAIMADEADLENAGFLVDNANPPAVWDSFDESARLKIEGQVNKSLADRGLDLSLTDLRPWAALLVYQQSFADEGMDSQIGRLFAKKDRLGLECVDELGFMFEPLSNLSVNEIEQAILSIPADQTRLVEEQTEQYLRGMLLTNDQFIRDSGDEFLVRRNRELWLPRLREYFSPSNEQRRPYVVVVGQLHLPGKSGLLALLKENGFVIKRLDLQRNRFVSDDISKYQ